MRKTWEIKCITNEEWAKEQQGTENPSLSENHVKKHNNSELQKYDAASNERKQQIQCLRNKITAKDISRALVKISHRKSVGRDQISSEIFKENQPWITPILQQLYSNCAKNNAMP